VVVGTLGRAQGLKGEVRVYPVTDQPKKRLSRAGVRLWLQPTPVKGQPVPGSSQVQQVEVQHGRIIKPPTAQDREIWAVKFKGVADRTQVGRNPKQRSGSLPSCHLSRRAAWVEGSRGSKQQWTAWGIAIVRGSLRRLAGRQAHKQQQYSCSRMNTCHMMHSCMQPPIHPTHPCALCPAVLLPSLSFTPGLHAGQLHAAASHVRQGAAGRCG
jgi:hypothetical protein